VPQQAKLATKLATARYRRRNVCIPKAPTNRARNTPRALENQSHGKPPSPTPASEAGPQQSRQLSCFFFRLFGGRSIEAAGEPLGRASRARLLGRFIRARAAAAGSVTAPPPLDRDWLADLGRHGILPTMSGHIKDGQKNLHWFSTRRIVAPAAKSMNSAAFTPGGKPQ
jgi:hypothetical protein